MFISLGQLPAPSAAVVAAPPKPLVSGIKDLDAIDLAVVSALTITGPLASSPSENEPMRNSLATALNQAGVAAGRFAASLSADLGWDAEPKAFLAVKDDAEKLATSASSKKTASWGILDTGVRGIQSRLAAARSATFARALSEAESAKNRARALILGFVASKPMSENDWETVAKLADDVQAEVATINKLPLSPGDAPLYLGAGRQLQGEIDMRLEAVSTGFMNSTEGLTRRAGMSPQRGRWMAAWLERNKWPILGVCVVGVAFEAGRRRKK